MPAKVQGQKQTQNPPRSCKKKKKKNHLQLIAFLAVTLKKIQIFEPWFLRFCLLVHPWVLQLPKIQGTGNKWFLLPLQWHVDIWGLPSLQEDISVLYSAGNGREKYSNSLF